MNSADNFEQKLFDNHVGKRRIMPDRKTVNSLRFILKIECLLLGRKCIGSKGHVLLLLLLFCCFDLLCLFVLG